MAVVSLSKGQKVSLTKEAPGLSKVIIGLGWDPVEEQKQTVVKKPGALGRLFGAKERTVEVSVGGEDIDCDAFAVPMDDHGNVIDTLYFGKTDLFGGALHHTGDNLTGDGDGDDEQIIANLADMPSEVEKIILAVNIYRGNERHQTFGSIQNAFIRIVNTANNQEMCRFELSNNSNYSDVVTMIFGSLIKSGSEWSFEAIGEPSNADSIATFVKNI